MRRAQNQQMRAQLPSPPCPPAELPLPQTSTLRSRRRLANILVAAGFIYMLCWMPHVCCLLIREFSIDEGCSNTAKEFFMLLGWDYILCSMHYYERFLFFKSHHRIYTFSGIPNHPLGFELQFTPSIGLSALRKAQFSAKIFTITFKIYGSTSACTFEHKRSRPRSIQSEVHQTTTSNLQTSSIISLSLLNEFTVN